MTTCPLFHRVAAAFGSFCFAVYNIKNDHIAAAFWSFFAAYSVMKYILKKCPRCVFHNEIAATPKET